MPKGQITIKLLCRGLNEVIITYDELNNLINTNETTIPKIKKETAYHKKIQAIISELDPNKTLPFGDMDPNFMPKGDYDGDGICNCDEVMVYKSCPDYPTITLPLSKGLNLFYFPSVVTKVSDNAQNIINQIYYYEPFTKTWEKAYLNFLVPKHFNAIDASEQG